LLPIHVHEKLLLMELEDAHQGDFVLTITFNSIISEIAGAETITLTNNEVVITGSTIGVDSTLQSYIGTTSCVVIRLQHDIVSLFCTWELYRMYHSK
jgi:hypothetical protein